MRLIVSVRHAKWLKYPLSQEVFMFLARGILHYEGNKYGIGIGIDGRIARLKNCWFIINEFQQFFLCPFFIWIIKNGKVKSIFFYKIPDTAFMIHQLCECNDIAIGNLICYAVRYPCINGLI